MRWPILYLFFKSAAWFIITQFADDSHAPAHPNQEALPSKTNAQVNTLDADSNEVINSWPIFQVCWFIITQFADDIYKSDNNTNDAGDGNNGDAGYDGAGCRGDDDGDSEDSDDDDNGGNEPEGEDGDDMDMGRSQGICLLIEHSLN